MNKLKITIVMLLLLGYSTLYAQIQEKTDISFNNITLRKAINQLDKKLLHINFSHNSNLKGLNKKITKKYTAQTVDYILKDLLLNTSISYKKVGKTIVLIRKKRVEKRAEKRTISGYIYDKKSGETLIGATIILPNFYVGTTTNSYGFYSISIPKNTPKLKISYLGYKDKTVDVLGKERVAVYLEPTNNEIGEVIVSSTKNTPRVAGIDNITVQNIKDIPQVLGEPDILKFVQTQGGVKTVTDGASFYYVRGGNFDQNLVLLDEAPLYNPSHIMGFVSVINGDAIKSSNFYKGYFPSKYSGRLASVLDVATKDGNNQEFHLNGGVSTIGLRLTAEGPIVKNKASYMVSVRKSWIDEVIKLMNKKDDILVPSFYDFNAKVNWKADDNNRIYFSTYYGGDKIKYDPSNFNTKWHNLTSTLRWNHVYSSKLFSNTSLVYNNFNSSVKVSKNTTAWLGSINEGRIIHKMSYFMNENHTLSGGLKVGYHQFKPGWNKNNSVNVGTKKLMSSDLFLSHKAKITPQLTVDYGLNLKMVKTLADKNRIELNDKYEVVKEYTDGNGGNKTWFEVEPRVNIDYKLNENSHIFTSYSRMNQFSHSLYPYQNDLNIFKMWVPVSNNIKPMQSDIFSAGYGYASSNFSVGLEAYYKDIRNQLDYTAYPDLQSKYYERYLRAGKGYSFGAELNIGYKTEKYSVEANYAYSKTRLTTPDVNGGREYTAKYDIPHQINVTGKYNINKRWQASAFWKFASGKPFTLPVGTQMVNGGQTVIPIYGERYNARFPNYHRLDVMFTLLPRNINKKFKGTFSFGIVNIYGKDNPLSIDYRYDYTTMQPQSQVLFKWFPTLSYQIKL